MTSTSPIAVKLEDDVLRKFYRAFHKHGPGNWAKMAKDTKITVEQCETLHKQHMSFLSLPASAALETAFLALVNDQYNSSQNHTKDEGLEDEAVRSARAARREAEDPEVNLTVSTSQKPRRTPKPTPQRLAAEEEAAARRLARANQGTPKSARAKIAAKPPPSPPGGEWTSSQRKRSRKLFEDSGEPDGPRYRSPIIDRWRGRHNTDVDEGVDALLSLASGAHALEEHPSTTDVATGAGDVDEELETHEAELLQATPKRSRGGRGGRSTPTPTGTPVKGSARAAAEALAASGAAGMRSPKGRGGAAAATTPARAGASGMGRLKKEQRGSPTSSAERGPRRGTDGGDVLGPLAGADAGEGHVVAGPGGEAGEDGAVAEHGRDAAETGAEDGTVAGATLVPISASGRPVRKRKPTAIALAAAAAAEEEDMIGGRGNRGVVAAIAAAVAATGAALPENIGSGSMPDGAGGLPAAGGFLGDMNGGSQAAEMMSNTAALLASVPPVRTRASARIAAGGPGSRRATERASPALLAAAGEDEGADEPDAAAAAAESEGREPPGPGEEGTGPEAGEQEATLVKAEVEGDGAGPGPSAEAHPPAELPVAPTSGRGRGRGAGHGAGARLGSGRGSAQQPPGRKRRRKSRPERLPPLYEELRVAAAMPGPGSITGAAAIGAPTAADGDGTGPAEAGVPMLDASADAAAGAAAASSATESAAAATAAGPAPSGEVVPAMPAAEAVLRHCLGPKVRRWCMYEFFYSALDRPWFMRNELLEFCLHMQLPTTKLTRYEWAVLRGALGRPRRLSLSFLRDERLRLEGYRENARLKYDEVALGMEVPPELPRQLRVGQEVTARHPVSRQMHDGVILTVKGNTYRVQFHRGDLMTEVVRDTEVMPVDPHECMPLHLPVVPPLLNGRPYDPVRLATLRGGLPGLAMAPMAVGYRPVGAWATTLDNQMMRDQDASLLLEAQRAMETKELLVQQLNQLNNEAASGLHSDENGGCNENFQLQYTRVVLQLKETNAALESAMARLQSRSQQVMAANIPLGAMLALHQQQQQQQQLLGQQSLAAQPAGGLPGAPLAPDAGGARAGVSALPAGGLAQQPPQQQPVTDGQASTPPLPVQQALTPPQAPSPTAAAAGGIPVVLPPAGAHARGAAGKGTGTAPPLSPSAPLVVPPLRPSAVTAAGAAASQSSLSTQQAFALGAQALSHTLLTTSSPEQLVEHAFVEARSVVDACRGKYGDAGLSAQTPLLPPPPPGPLGPGPQAVPVLAPIVAMQIQPAGGAPVPLILPPGAVLPQQATLPPHSGAAEPNLQQQHSQQQQDGGRSGLAAGSGDASGNGEGLADGTAAVNGDGVASGLSAEATAAMLRQLVKVEPGTGEGQVAPVTQQTGPPTLAAPGSQAAPPLTEEELAESWLRDVIVGCVGMLFTIQKCTAGNVSAGTVAEALDLAVKQLRIKTDGENDGLYQDIVQSVEGLKGYLTKAIA